MLLDVPASGIRSETVCIACWNRWEKNHEKICFCTLHYSTAMLRAAPGHQNHQFSWKSTVFIDFISVQFSLYSYLRVPLTSIFTPVIMLFRINRFVWNFVTSLDGVWNTWQAILFCCPGLIMGRNRWSTQNRVCKWKVFGALAATQIQATRQTSWIMGLKSVCCNDSHRCWYNCAESALPKYSNSLKNDIKVRILHSKTMNFTQIHVKIYKNRVFLHFRD